MIVRAICWGTWSVSLAPGYYLKSWGKCQGICSIGKIGHPADVLPAVRAS